MWWPLASSFHWSLRLPCLLGILLTTPIVLLFTLFAEPRVGMAWVGKLEELQTCLSFNGGWRGKRVFSGGAYICLQNRSGPWPSVDNVMRQCSAISDLSSVRFSCPVVSDSLQPHGLWHTRVPCPSPTPRAYSNSCQLSQWCHPTISSSVLPLLLPPSMFHRIRIFSNESVLRIRWPKYWSFSFNIRPSNEYSGLISFRWTDWISLQSKGLTKVFSNTTIQKHKFFSTQHSLWTNSHIHTWLLKNHSFD